MLAFQKIQRTITYYFSIVGKFGLQIIKESENTQLTEETNIFKRSDYILRIPPKLTIEDN